MSGRILHKFIKYPIAQYIKRFRDKKDAKDKFQYFKNEFASFPLNLKLYFKLKLVYDYTLYQVRDYIMASKLQHEWQLHTSVLGNKMYILNIDPHQGLDSQQPGKPVFDFDLYKLKEIPTSLIYRALQSKTYNDSNRFNYEVLEFLGDGILKLLASIEVFVKHPLEMEGFLHVKRAKIVSNENLRRIGIKQYIFKYILTDRLDYYPKEFRFNQVFDDPSDLARNSDKELRQEVQEYRAKILERKDNEKQKITLQDRELLDIPYGFRYIPEKVHADVIEALNGVFMKHYEKIEACQHFLHCIGLLEYPTLELQIVGKKSKPL